MARIGVSGRERACVACENPSAGPIKLLHYRWRLHGPFFPLLERLKNDDNARLFSNGRVSVCNSCATFLQRQWSDYERKSISLPIDKRTYRLLSEERWEKMNHKNQMEEARRRANERSLEESSYDDNELLEITPTPTENIKLVRKSKIPRLAKPDRGLPPEKTPEVSLEIVQRSTDPDMEEHVRTAASKMAGEQQSKLLKKLAEIKFKEELDYVQRKVQKTMGIVHLKGREERIREIELELEEKIRTGNESRSGLSSSHTLSPKTLNPLVHNEQESISELKQHIKKEMAIQREEMETFRKSIKNEISQAMEESYRRNEELWQLIKLINEEKRSSPFHSRQHRPYSDGDELYKLPKVSKSLARRRRTSADDYEEPESDTQYNGQR